MNPAVVVLGASPPGRTAAERADIDDSPLTSLNKYKYRILIAFALPIAVLFFEVYMPMYTSSFDRLTVSQKLDTIDAHIDLDPPVAKPAQKRLVNPLDEHLEAIYQRALAGDDPTLLLSSPGCPCGLNTHPATGDKVFDVFWCAQEDQLLL